MPISAAGKAATRAASKFGRGRHQVQPCISRGFTLVELLVVVLIVGLSIGLIMLQVGDNSALELRYAARDFTNHTALVAEEAVLTGEQWGIDLYRNDDIEESYGYRWLFRKDGAWQVAALPDIPPARDFPAQVRPRLELEGVEQEIELKLPEPQRIEDEPLEPDILLLSSGEMTPFVLRLEVGPEAEIPWVVRADQLGRIRLETAETGRR